ncbi:MAG: 2-C-methyl-D-erythritol 4-phosphate cytidylyltransferase [Deferrisomatales bacterium]|nr:2-C-methyl-D-erythritol 4-phosphate cytidylyltransferase [Deferrisomatales bacterium]
MKVFAVVPAAGLGRRLGAGEPKQFLPLAGRPLLVHTLERLHTWPRLCGSVVVAPPEQLERVRGMIEGAGLTGVLAVVPGGEERQDSVALGLRALEAAGATDTDVVLVHDAARPFPPVHRFDALLEAALPDGALLAAPCADTLKREHSGTVADTVDRSGLWQAQTPQAFPVALLRRALDAARKQGVRGTDEASLVERLGCRPRLVTGGASNFKVTRLEDLEMAEALVRSSTPGVGAAPRVHLGHGYDVHRLVPGRRLILGGVEIEHPLGLQGHSDADVLAHAVADACLGAAGRGDLGRWFPDSDPRWAGVSSLTLLEEIAQGLRESGHTVQRVDATLVAERPKIAAHVPAMEQHLAGALGLEPGAVTVKATTTEGLGFEGRQEGISAHAVALVTGPAARLASCS